MLLYEIIELQIIFTNTMSHHPPPPKKKGQNQKKSTLNPLPLPKNRIPNPSIEQYENEITFTSLPSQEISFSLPMFAVNDSFSFISS